jgi:hypothetical protein
LTLKKLYSSNKREHSREAPSVRRALKPEEKTQAGAFTVVSVGRNGPVE